MWAVISVGRGSGVTVDDEPDELVVLLEVAGAVLPARRQLEPDASVAVGLVPEVVEHPDDDVVVRRGVEGAVDLAVRGERRLAPLPGDGLEPLQRCLHPYDVLVRAALGGQRDGGRLEGTPGLEQLPGLVEVELGDAGVAVGVEPDPALPAESSYGLAQRRDADAQVGGELVLRQG